MNERQRQRNAPRDIDPDLPIESGNGLGGAIPSEAGDRLEEREPAASDEVLDDEEDTQSAENDQGLVSGDSPEFQHLTKPQRKNRT
ncbi:MAG: hypothetical protein ACR2OE_18355 [Thermomicrobiales bacterium]